MNQFKKAKMKLIEQGQEVEQITDLKTAGVKENKQTLETSKASPEEKSEIDETIIEEKEEKKIEEIVEDVIVIEEKPPIIIEETASTTEISNTAEEKPIKPQNDEIPVAVSVSKVEQKESIVSDQVQTIETTPEKKVDLENTNLETKTINHSNSISEKPLTETVTQREFQTIIEQPKVEPQKIIEQPEIVIVQQQSKITQPTVNSQPAKKTIPNIFSPKEEPKSMRKSLVLKPTSVKKAESYCNKNGGSFNELIQTLLDNFINEYGL